MTIEASISPADIRRVLDYDPVSGKLFWLTRPLEMFPNERGCNAFNRSRAGKEAFTSTDPDGYKQGSIFNRKMRAHRVIFAWVYGRWPSDQVDHINGDRADNRIENLRNVQNRINARNMRTRPDSTYPGVYPSSSGKRWQARITVDYQNRYLGTFDSAEEAIAARRSAELASGFRPLETTYSNRAS